MSPLSQHLWTPNLAVRLLIMNGSQKSHVTRQFCSHMTIRKRYVSSATSSMAPILSRMCTYVERSSRTKPDDTSVSWSRCRDFIFTFIFTLNCLWSVGLAKDERTSLKKITIQVTHPPLNKYKNLCLFFFWYKVIQIGFLLH